MDQRQRRSEMDLLASGITFTVYQDETEVDRIFPFSIVPRIVAHDEWETIDTGLKQRVKAINAFLHDVYHDQRCVTDGVIPGEVLFGAAAFNLRMVGFEPPRGVYTHIAGSDLIRDRDGEFRILEDNVRTPSGVSYVLENRRVMLESVPELFPGRAPSSPSPTTPSTCARCSSRCGRRASRRRRRASSSSRRGASTPPTSSTPSSPSRWASTSSRGATSSSTTRPCTCARRPASNAST